MLGLGKNVPLATGNGSEGLLALVDGKFLTFRVPYPMGFYAKGLDGRIDDPNAGWKGQGHLDDLRDPRAVPHGRRQGDDEQTDPVLMLFDPEFRSDSVLIPQIAQDSSGNE